MKRRKKIFGRRKKLTDKNLLNWSKKKRRKARIWSIKKKIWSQWGLNFLADSLQSLVKNSFFYVWQTLKLFAILLVNNCFPLIWQTWTFFALRDLDNLVTDLNCSRYQIETFFTFVASFFFAEEKCWPMFQVLNPR